jgi:hypothetical protein
MPSLPTASSNCVNETMEAWNAQRPAQHPLLSHPETVALFICLGVHTSDTNGVQVNQQE